MKRLSRGISLLLAVAAATVAFGGDLKMDVRSSFEGRNTATGVQSVTVELRNDGEDAVGVVRVSSGRFQTDYPVELPRGAHKLLFTFPTVSFDQVQYQLLTNRGRVNATFNPTMDYQQSQQTVLTIGDAIGELSFIRPKSTPSNTSGEVTLIDAYVKPESAPNRAVAFTGIRAVVLSAGAERLSDESVEALKLWTLTGGTIMFLGGASAPVLKDPRWAGLVPVRNLHTQNLAHSAGLAALGGTAPPQATLMTGDPIWKKDMQTEGDVLITTTGPYGLGSAVYVAFNPLEPPLNQWAGRAKAFRQLLNPAAVAMRVQYLRQFSKDDDPNVLAKTGVPAATPAEQDPFSTSLPSPASIFTILAIYFVVVVPINFMVLRRMGKVELAWFTAPLISLIFAGILFTKAQSLYSAKLSTATQGLLVVQDGNAGMFVGTSQVFIPISGVYDLKFQNVDSVGMLESADPYTYGAPNTESLELNPIDDGEVRVSRLSANNLAFKEIRYRQRTEPKEWFRVTRSESGVDVFNDSASTLTNGEVYLGAKRYKLKEPLKPGGHVRVSGKPETSYSDPASLAMFLADGQLAVAGTIDGFRPGPRIGSEVTSRSRIRIACFMGAPSR